MNHLFVVEKASATVPVVGSCTGKAAFKARAIAASVQKRREAKGKSGTVYHCENCGAWHIGRRTAAWEPARG